MISLSRWRSLGISMATSSSFTLRFYRKQENQEKKGDHELRSSVLKRRKKGERYDAYIRSTPGD